MGTWFGRPGSQQEVASRGRRSRSLVRVLVVLICTTASSFVLVQAAAARPAAAFVSKLYGYSIALPGSSSAWLTSFATVKWSGDPIEHGSPEFDTFTDLRDGRIYFLAARPGVSSLTKRTAFVVSARPDVCGTPRSLPGSKLAGAHARVLTWSCSDGYRVIVTAALHAHRGYVMLVASLMTLSHASDLRAAAATRRSFRFLNK